MATSPWRKTRPKSDSTSVSMPRMGMASAWRSAPWVGLRTRVRLARKLKLICKQPSRPLRHSQRDSRWRGRIWPWPKLRICKGSTTLCQRICAMRITPSAPCRCPYTSSVLSIWLQRGGYPCLDRSTVPYHNEPLWRSPRAAPFSIMAG